MARPHLGGCTDLLTAWGSWSRTVMICGRFWVCVTSRNSELPGAPQGWRQLEEATRSLLPARLPSLLRAGPVHTSPL